MIQSPRDAGEKAGGAGGRVGGAGRVDGEGRSEDGEGGGEERGIKARWRWKGWSGEGRRVFWRTR